MTPEELTEKLKSCYGPALKSVVLYGSAAAGDFVQKKSDFNILVLLEKIGLEDLKKFSKTAKAWTKKGNPPPLFFAQERFKQSADVFPVEIADIRGCHKILHGEDPFTDIRVDERLLRLELEHELKGKLIQLRERYLLAEGHDRDLKNLMINSLSTFLVLFRNALRLYDQNVPHKKLDALAQLAKHMEFDQEIFLIIERLKEGGKEKSLSAEELFQRYLSAIETVVDTVDGHIHQQTS